MINLPIINIDGEAVGKHSVKVSAGDEAQLNTHGLYLVNNFQRAASRQGTSSTKTRSEVRGGGAKPYKQKGTGKARRGSNRTPLRRGGAVIFGPKPRDFAMRMNSKLFRKVARSVFLQKKDAISLLDANAKSKVKTKGISRLVESKMVDSASGRVVFITTNSSDSVSRGFRNIPNVSIVNPNSIQVLDVLASDHVFISKSAFEWIEKVYLS